MKSLLILSFQQIFNKKILKILVLHSFITFTCVGILIYFFNQIISSYLQELILSIFNFFSSENSNEGIIFYIAKIISFLLSWFVFVYILIPISSIIGLLFEEQIFEKILEFRKINFEYKKLKISIILLFFFVLKNLFKYIIINLIAIPFYLSLPAINIMIFITLNGYLLGIQTYQGIILSYFNQKKVHQCISQNKFDLFIIGSFLTILYLIPLINFFAPIFTILIFLNYFITKDYK
tara:strand:- start:73 stop:780 length:708 start_codon:yes stop_codon:yes gene_type:complete